MTFKKHIGETAMLSWPLIISQVGYIITGIVDNIFLGQIGKTEQAVGFLANNIFILLLVFSIGMSYSLTPLVTNADVNQDNKQKASLLKNGLFLNFFISILLGLILYFASPILNYMQQPKDVVEMAIPFFNVLIFSIVPCSLFFVGKQYTEGLNNTITAMIISVGGNILNIILNYILINGKFGFPEMGYMGPCWATFIARCFMGFGFLVLLFKAQVHKEVIALFKDVSLNFKDQFNLFKFGIGSALQFTFEVAGFVCCSLMMGWFGKESIDSHGIAMSLAAFTYMFGSGISGAATIRVGKFKSLGDIKNTRLAANSALLSALSVTIFFALVFLALHNYMPYFFSKDMEIIELASQLLIIAGFFQLFDGVQVTALGILRGLEDIKIPTIITLVGYWAICIPLAYFLGTYLNYQAKGIWYAILISLSFVAISLYWRIRVLVRK